MKATVNHLQGNRRLRNIEVVALVGGDSRLESSIPANVLCEKAAARVGGSSYYLYAPAIVDAAGTAVRFKESAEVRDVLRRARNVDIALVGIGSAGDEPAAAFQLFEFTRTLGFEVVAAGKGKNNPLNREATPAMLGKTASDQEMSVKMLTSFMDGTKTMVEMTALSNATGLIPDVSDMHGPTVGNFKELPSVFDTRNNKGVLSREGVVDYALGDIAPGVFVVFRSDIERIQKSLRYSKMGPGPNHVLYRPYHLRRLQEQYFTTA